MSRVRHHLLLPPLELPGAPQYRSDTASLRNAANLYEQLIGKGYTPEKAEQVSMAGRLSGAVITYTEPVDGAA